MKLNAGIASLSLVGLMYAMSSSAASSSSSLGGIQSIYTDVVSKLWLKEPTDVKQSADPSQVFLGVQCLTTEGNDTYIGIHQSMIIRAPIQEVEKVLDDVPGYTHLFEDLNKSEIIERKDNRFVVFSEQHIPIPFVSNERNELIYEKDAAKKGLIRFRYQLKSSNHLKANDGVILLKALENSQTFFEEYDFWDAHWGIAKTFGINRIWKDSVKGVTQADLAIKFKAENPSWSHEKAKEESFRAQDAFPIEDCVKQRKPFQ